MYKKTILFFPGNRASYLKNGIFNQEMDEWNPIFIRLKKFLKSRKIDINTFDIPLKYTPDIYLFHDVPYLWNFSAFSVWKMILQHKEKNILLTHETPSIIPYTYWRVTRIFFKKIYTWNDDWVDNKKYFKFYIPKLDNGWNTSIKPFKNKKFLALINANKLPFPPLQFLSPLGRELFSERIKAIEFFEKNIPDKFSLYGRGWNKPRKYSLLEPVFGYKKYSTYKGEIGMDDKIEVLSNFKFCVCFENLTDVKGYITEKVFDCFKAKCVPIYWGATNIKEYIPKECFIDFRDFGYDYQKLLNFLESIDNTTYNRYIKNIKKLLSNKKFVGLWFKGFSIFFLEKILEA